MTKHNDPLAYYRARTYIREDMENAARNPGTPVLIRNTVGTARNAQYVRAHEYRKGIFPYGLSLDPDAIASAQYDPKDDGVHVVFREGVVLPRAEIEDFRVAAVMLAHETGKANWPGGELSPRNRNARNERLAKAGLRIDTDGYVRRIPEGE